MHNSFPDSGTGTNKKLYEIVADSIVTLIDQGVYAAGQRVPSLRRVTRDYGVSLSTSMEAFRLLEDWGKIEGRPQSGFYVKNVPHNVDPTPQKYSRELMPTNVNINTLALRLLADVGDRRSVQFGSAVPDPAILPLAKLRSALSSVIREDDGDIASYDMAPGCLPLRIQIAKRSLKCGCAFSPQDIVTTNGAQEAVSLCLRAVCVPGDTVAVESPMFYGILQIIEVHGLNAIEVPSHPRYGIDLMVLAQVIQKHQIAACIAITNFSNPSGGCVPTESKRQLVDLLSGHDIPLIEDDVYGDLAHNTERPLVAKAFDTCGNVLLCSSFSKTIAPGLRVGWCVPGKYLDEVVRQKVVANLSGPMITQLGVAAFLSSSGYDKHLRSTRRIYAERVHAMAAHLLTCFPPGTKVSRPSGGYILWVELPAGANTLRLYERAVQSGLTFAPGSVFSPSHGYSNYLRLNAAFWGPACVAPLETLGQFANDEVNCAK